MLPLAAVMPGLEGGTGFSWWQTVGGLAAVFALLLVFLKILGRLHGGPRQDRANLLAVWNLGPRREIQVLRLGDEVHYIYRHDGAMVLLKQESFSAWEEGREPAEQPAHGGLPAWIRDRLPALAPGRSGAAAAPLPRR